jgi:MATE family multidrug resistance protein
MIAYTREITMFVHRTDLKIMLSLAIPLILTGLVEASVGFISSLFMAHLGAGQLGIGGEVVWFFATLMIIMWSVVSAISIIVPHKDGENDQKGIATTLRDGLWLAIILVIPTTLLIWNMGPILLYFGQPEALVMQAVPYMHALSWGVFPDLLGLTLIQFVIGLKHMRTNLVFSITWVAVNIFLNTIFTFGYLGLPHFGIAGLGWGTTISYWVTTIGFVVYMLMRKCYRPYWWALTTRSNFQAIWLLIKIGLPMGVMLLLEIGFFFVLALIMGHIGVAQLAANQLTMQYIGFFVAIAFSVAQAITVRMGNELGAKNIVSANRAVYAGIYVALSLTLIVVLLELFAPHWLISLDFSNTQQHAVISHFAVQFLAVAAVFQLMESIRICFFGALRAFKDTHFPMISSFIAFWGIAIPLGYWLAIPLNFGAVGLWWALAASGLINLSILILRYRHDYRKVKKNVLLN